jgi:hypothetical protein
MVILIKGKNKTNARHAFTMRKNYKFNGFPTQGLPLAIDFLYDQPYYGRVDHNGNAVYLSEAHLGQVSNTGDRTVQALDFVVDAFHSFTRDMYGLRQSRCKEGSVFKNIRAVKGWPPGGIHSMYRLYEEMIYRTFVRKFLNQRDRKNNIVSIETFMQMFKQFVDKMVPEYPITRTGLLLSKYSDPLLSGLILEIADADHSDDKLKNRMFIRDPDFPIYRKVAAKHGFMLDKNAPWRLVANIKSKNMLPYMSARDKDHESIFRRCFYSCHRGGVNFVGNDITELQVFVYGMYASFVNSNPVARKVEENKSACLSQRNVAAYTKNLSHLNNRAVSTKIKILDRPQVTLEEFKKKYGQFFWMRMYMYIRAKENGKTLTEKQLNNKTKKMMQIYKALDIGEALRYINDETK